MAHKTKIGGTAYNIVGGKTKIGGTTYTINGGKTKIGGTVYGINFATLINFTIDGVDYQAEEGMTWADWCSSNYNTGGFYNDGSYIMYSDNSEYGDFKVVQDITNYKLVSPDDVISEYSQYSYSYV